MTTTDPHDPDAYDPDLPLPSWAPPGSDWEAIIRSIRLWLRPDDNLLSDAEIQMFASIASSFLGAVRQSWMAKIRYYADPNRIIRGQIGNESLQFPDPKDLIAWAKGIIDDLDQELGVGGSRVFAYSAGPGNWWGAQVWGVTDYELAPPPIAFYGPSGRRPGAWDLTRFPPQAWINRSPWPYDATTHV